MTGKIAISETELFLPRYKSLSKDVERLTEQVADLFYQGRLQKENGVALAATYIAPASERLIDAYFARGLYAEIESYWTYTETPFGWPCEGLLEGWERLVAAGQGQRAIRLWRNHLAQVKALYWHLIDKRTRGFEMSPHDMQSEARQRADYKRLIAPIPKYKSDILAMMDAAGDFFEHADANKGQLARLTSERAEVEAEERQRAGEPDPRKMGADVFWEIIAAPDDGGITEQIDTLPDRLARFKATSIKAFDALLHDMDARAYRSEIWALAYLLNDGCSDDDFAAFRCWLVLQGRESFEAILVEPDAFDVAGYSGDFGGCGGLWDAPLLAYEMRTGKALKRKRAVLPKLGGPELEEDAFAETLPRVAAAAHG